METLVFYIAGGLSLFFAIGMVVNSNPVASAVSLVVTMFCLSILYVTLSAHLIAILQILIYAGAIIVLFLFVIMLLNLKEYKADMVSFKGVCNFQYIIVGILLISAGKIISILIGKSHTFNIKLHEHFGEIKEIGRLLFVRYLVPFELISILLLVAIIGAIVLAKSRLT